MVWINIPSVYVRPYRLVCEYIHSVDGGRVLYVDLGTLTGVTSNAAQNFTIVTPVTCAGAFVREASATV